jgi:outer membrane lipoprotein carrier protein
MAGELHKPEDLLGKITKTYRTAGLVETKIEKVITYDWKPKEDVSSGRFFYSKGKVRTEFDTPEKNWSIYNGKQWWSIQFASPDFPGKNKVTHTTVSSKDKEQFFLLKLINLKKPSDQFKIEVASTKDPELNLKLEPKLKAEGLTDIHVTINLTKKYITEVSFKDDMGNKTTLKLSSPKYKDSPDSGEFEYKPDPKKDEVSEL